jgi:hypothetical protein
MKMKKAMPTESNVLQELAKRFKGRLSQCQVYDANVCTSRSVPGRPWELLPVSGEPFFQMLRFTCRGRKVTVLANRTYVHGAANGTFASMPLTINAKQMLFRSEFACALHVGGQRYAVFTEDGKVSSVQKYALSRPELTSLVKESGLQEGESLYFTKGEIGFYLKRPGTDRTIGIIDQVIQLAANVENDEEELNLELLPVQFHAIIPTIKRWAVADDSERDDLLSTTPEVVLRSLTDEVIPYLDAIDSYLDSFRGEAPTEQAAALGRLAECALEAKQRLVDKAGP